MKARILGSERRKKIRSRKQKAASTSKLQSLCISDLERKPADGVSFVIQGWLPDREVTLLGGHGGTGKSFLALTAGVVIALGKPFYGIPTEKRRVVFVSLEDRPGVVRSRLASICADLQVGLSALEGRFLLVDGTHGDGTLYRGRDGQPTGTFSQLKEEVRPGDVIIIDSAVDAFDGDEINRRQVREFLRTLRGLVDSGGAVLLLAHVDKVAARGAYGAEGYSGSTAWNNSVRCRWYLRFDVDAKSLVLSVVKSNYGPTGQGLEVHWEQSAGVFRGKPIVPPSAQETAVLEADTLEWVVRKIEELHNLGEPLSTATTGSKNAAKVLREQVDAPTALQGKEGKKLFGRVLHRAKKEGRIATRELRDKKGNARVVYIVAEGATLDSLSSKIPSTQETGDSGHPVPEFKGGLGETRERGEARPGGSRLPLLGGRNSFSMPYSQPSAFSWVTPAAPAALDAKA